MRTHKLATATALLTVMLAGCTSTPTPAPTTAPEATNTDCIEVTEGVRGALQAGMDEKGAGYTIDSIAAVEDDEAGSWWVAAEATGDPDVTAVWYTQQNPGTADDAAFLSATELASLISSYAMPEDLTGADPLEEAIDCLQ